MVEELLKQRSTFKALVIESEMTLNCLIKERDFNLIHKHGVMMKYWFHSFDEASESYIETLSNETDITDAESYYDAVYDNYMDQLDSLNYAMDSLTMQAPAVVQRTDSNTTPSTMSHIVNLPTMVREQETKASIHSVQLDDQNNETVPMNSHHCTSQPSPCQQVQEVMNIELVHLSTCVHDHSTPNCDQSLLDLHTDVKAQSEASIATITMEQQLQLVDCGTPVTNQSLPVSPDPHNDQADLQVQSPTPCAHCSLRPQTIHPARDVIVSTPIQLANTSRSTDHHILNAPLQVYLELKENYTHSHTPRPGQKVKDGTLHIPGKPRPTAYHFLSGIT